MASAARITSLSMAFFDQITLLITHYNRSTSLERLLNTLSNLDLTFAEIVVSDDGSRDEHLGYIKKLQSIWHFKLVESAQNMGLGNNINKGQGVVNTPYTLYIQEDFVPLPEFPKALADSFKFMQEDPAIDIARYYAYFRYPYLADCGSGFFKMYFPVFSNGYRKFYAYSDHPHLRRTSFPNKFGLYREDLKPDATEYNMMMWFLKKRGKGIFYGDYKSLFDQQNSSLEPSTIGRSSLRTTDNPLIASVRHVYRYVKFYYNYFF